MDIEQPFDSRTIDRHAGSSLPQWRQDEAIYFVTFRLADSLPKPILRNWDRSRRDWLLHSLELNVAKTLAGELLEPFSLNVEAAIAKLSDADHREYQRRFTAEWHGFLDAGYGDCILRGQECRTVVCNALSHFDGERYELSTSVVMPNHVHALIRPLGHELSKITHSWKSFTAKAMNRLLEREGVVWQRESFNRIVRSQANLECYQNYIRNNPIKAKLGPSEYTLLKG